MDNVMRDVVMCAGCHRRGLHLTFHRCKGMEDDNSKRETRRVR